MDHRVALCIGLDHYPGEDAATSCVDDAKAVAKAFAFHGDGRTHNFETVLLTSENNPTFLDIRNAITRLFETPASLRLLYFAGHGNIDLSTGSGHLLTLDSAQLGTGIAFSDVMAEANRNSSKSMEANIILLDCCRSGAIGQTPNQQGVHLGPGVTVLTACTERQNASSDEKVGGVFTSLLLTALDGAAADVTGHITPASVYAHIDQSLGSWAQRPVYKANVQHFVSLRKVKPLVEISDLAELPSLFPDPDAEFLLDPSFEPEIKEGHENDYPKEVRQQNQVKFRILQNCNRASLVVPVGAKDMYFAAIDRQSCKLTPIGKHYRKLAETGKLK